MSNSATPRPTAPEAEAPGLLGLRCAVSLILLLTALATILPGHWLWGLGHWSHWPAPLAGALFLIGVLLAWSKAGAALGRILISGIDAILKRAFLTYGVAPAAAAALFWLLRSKVHFLGDGWLLGELVNKGMGYHGFDFVDFLAKARLYHAFRLTTEAEAFALFAIISVAAGGLYVMVAGFLARRFSDDPGERALAYALLILMPAVQLFFGYVECYAMLSASTLLFLGTLVLHYRRSLPAYVPAAAFGLGLLSHLDVLFLAPLLVLLILYPPLGDRRSLLRRSFEVKAPVVAALVAVFGVYLLSGYTYERFQLDFLTGREGQRLLVRLQGSHGLFSGVHWKDVLNLILLLAAVPLALVVGALDGRKTPRLPAWPRELVVTGIGSIWLVLLAALLHMKLGIARDWDLLAAQSPVFLLTALLWWRHRHGSGGTPQLVGMTVGLALLLTGSWIAVNANEEAALARFRGIIADQPRFARAYSHEEIGKYYRKSGQTEKAYADYRRCIEIFPENARFHCVLGALQYQEGLMDEALETFTGALEVDSTSTTGLEMIARIHVEAGRLETGLGFSRRLAGRRGESARAAAVHGYAADHLGLTQEAVAAFERAVRKEPEQTPLIRHLGSLYFDALDFAKAEGAYRELLRREPRSPAARIGLLMALWGPMRQNRAAWAQPGAQARIREARTLLQGLAAEGQLDERLRPWALELEQAAEAP